MNPFLRFMSMHIPARFKKEKIIQLFELTSGVFNDYRVIKDKKDLVNTANNILKDLDYERLLEKYAEYTGRAVEILLESRCDKKKLKEALFEKAFMLGQKIQKDYNIKTFGEARYIIRLIYKIVRIDCDLKTEKNTGSRELDVRSCYFSSYYTADVCSVMSAVDEGIISGVAGYRSLQFIQRITEGNDHCRAVLKQ